VFYKAPQRSRLVTEGKPTKKSYPILEVDELIFD